MPQSLVPESRSNAGFEYLSGLTYLLVLGLEEQPFNRLSRCIGDKCHGAHQLFAAHFIDEERSVRELCTASRGHVGRCLRKACIQSHTLGNEGCLTVIRYLEPSFVRGDAADNMGAVCIKYRRDNVRPTQIALVGVSKSFGNLVGEGSKGR